MECIFCKIIAQDTKEDVVFENDQVLVMLDIDWATKGHILIIWKEHAENISELSKEDFLYFSRVVHQTDKILLQELEVDKVVVLKSGGIITHFHFHLYPINKNVSWEVVKDMFDKKVRYEPKEGEKEKLLKSLRKQFSIQ